GVSLLPGGGIQHAQATVGFQCHPGYDLTPPFELLGIPGYGGWQLPKSGDLVLPCRQDCLAIVPEGYLLDGAGMEERWPERLPGRRVPEPGRLVPAPRQDGGAVDAERHGVHRTLVGQGRPERPAGRHVPEPGGIVGAPREEGLAVRTE